MPTSLFNSSGYYYVTSNFNGASYNLSDGYTGGSVPDTLSLTNNNTGYSSNNWQIFYQDSVYLIRNYDYKLSYQLGVNTTSSTPLPELLPASGQLTQQWNITKLSDGTYRLTNMELGNSQVFGVKVVLNGPSQLVMNPAETDDRWSLSINDDAPAVPQSMLQSVLLQAPSATSTGSSSATATITTAAPSATATGSTTSPSTASQGLTGGAIGGIVAAVIIAVLFALGLFIFMRRKRRRTIRVHEAPVHENPSRTPHEILSQPRYELGVSNYAEPTSNRATELSS